MATFLAGLRKKTSDKRKDDDESSTDDIPPEDLPPYLDTRSYDSIEHDREQEAIESIDRDMVEDELSPFSSTLSGRAKTFNINSLVPSYKSLNLLHTPQKFNVINKQNRDKFIMSKPRDQDRQQLYEAIIQNEDTVPINKDEWLASHILAVYHGTNWLHETLKKLLPNETLWSKQMNAPTLQRHRAKSRSGKPVQIDSHVIPWTFPPRGIQAMRAHKEMSASEYCVVAMDECKKHVVNKDIFPTKVGIQFNSEFDVVAPRILHLCQVVLSHFYTRNIFMLLQSNHLHTRLNMVFSHLVLVDQIFKLDVIDRNKHPLYDLIPVLVDPE